MPLGYHFACPYVITVGIVAYLLDYLECGKSTVSEHYLEN